jgi:hypothetical protein
MLDTARVRLLCEELYMTERYWLIGCLCIHRRRRCRSGIAIWTDSITAGT